MLVFIMSPHVCFYYVTKWGRCCSVFNGQAAHPVIPCCGCPHQITIPNNNNLSFKSQSQIIIMLGIFLSNQEQMITQIIIWPSHLITIPNTNSWKPSCKSRFKNRCLSDFGENAKSGCRCRQASQLAVQKKQKYKNTKIQKYKNTKIQKYKNTKSGGRCRQVPYNWLYNGQSKAKRSIRHQRQWLDHRPPSLSPSEKSSFSSFVRFILLLIIYARFQPPFEWQNLPYLARVHNPLKSFWKTTQIQLIWLIQMCRILI